LYCAAGCPCQGSCFSSLARNRDLLNAQARHARLRDEP
jgi:hypothetical protein